jgi:CDP-4-dehydro-6-deoxyglucose reductase, E3
LFAGPEPRWRLPTACRMLGGVADDDKLHHVTLMPERRTFSVRDGETILDAALHVGINLPHSCKGGSCGACRAKLLSGAVRYPFGAPLGITEQEQRDGYVLLCEAHATGNVSVDVREIRVADDVEIRDLPCRVARKELLAPDVMALFLQLPAVEKFTFLPGQYLDIMLPGERRRSFSIASPPHDSGLLELHVRRAPGGEFTQKVFEELKEKSLLRIEGPLGQFCYQHRPKVPALLVGGGTGFAPLKSMIRHVLENRLERRMHLYWGVRTARDLYEEATIRAWVAANPNFSYTPVLSAAEPGDNWTGRTGLVHEAVVADYPDLSGVDVYASGPPAMIEAVKHAGFARGLTPERLHFDSFEYAPDALAKIRQADQQRSDS